MTAVIPRRNGGVSFWYAQSGLPQRRPALPGDRDADVCIVGAGYTGLWTAYALKEAQPDLDVVVLDREFAGFGASGRNGGWLSDHIATPRAQVAKTHGRDALLALRRAMRETVSEVIGVCEREGIDAQIVKGGVLTVARGAAQVNRLRAEAADDREYGAGPDDLVELDRAALERRVHVARGDAGTWSPHAARIQPALLARGLADAVQRSGVTIHEDTHVTSVRSGSAAGPRGTVRAPVVLTCLEGFTAGLAGHRRDLMPLNSALVVTEPLDAGTWARIGWDRCEVLGDAAHVYIYAQRTADGRIALGGRGVPYRYGSRTDHDGVTQPQTIAQLVAMLQALFPDAAGAAIDHAWCGVLGVPRDWQPAVRFDPATGLGGAGGYVGSGVATANLAGRTLADLVLGRDTALARLPWVGHRARRWEPEPLRFIGARLVYGLYRAADRRESRSGGRTSRLATLATLLSGR